jgi:hydroxymethylglutaryl-CoA reductase
MDTRYLSKFYKKSQAEKITALKEAGAISPEDFEQLKESTLNLPAEIANRMIENYITNHELPFGVAMNFVINGKETLIPMVTEEPSVVAAASNAGKIIAQAGGFQTSMTKRWLIAQIALTNVKDSKQAQKTLGEMEDQILELADAAHPSIVNYGGGARKIDVRIIPADPAYNTPEFFVVHLAVDTGEAMGANIVNTMAEAVAPYIQELIDGESLMNILSNYSTESLVTATCTIDPELLATKDMAGETVRDRIIEATQFATVDPYRAVTHNKGIMNGIDSVLLATGNDWRAVEAGVHAYAAKSGQYRSLSKWTKDQNGHLLGEMTLPISVGSVGGTLSIHPSAQFAYRLLGEPNAKELSGILAAVGLAQNLSAVRALVTEGIQKGHMSLQARSLAIRVGAVGDQVEEVAKELQAAAHMNSETAKKILDRLSH